MSFYQLVFYVPESHLEAVKGAIFAAGAGVQGDYRHCAWQVKGQGQFRPMPGSNPFIGETDQLSREEEYKVEVYVAQQNLKDVMGAFFDTHPYEEPAYFLVKSMDARQFL
ncbi:NGG1p interacting factor NIF3 [uncultured Thiomicrorhabdus sp.]